MSAEFITVLDPGAVTGMSNWSLDTDMPMRRLEYRLIKGGLEGFVSFMGVWLGRARPDLILCEKWDATGSDRDDASYSYKIEGALYTMADALGLEIEFVTRTSKLLATDSFLKEQGLYISPKAAKVDPTIMHSAWKAYGDVTPAGRAEVVTERPGQAQCGAGGVSGTEAVGFFGGTLTSSGRASTTRRIRVAHIAVIEATTQT
jgi:hypothetical protein